MNKQRKFILIAGAIGVIAMFLPWVRISFLGFSNSVNGMHDMGILVFVCFLAVVGVALMGDHTQALAKTMWMVVLVAGGIAALTMVIGFFRLMDAISFISVGFYLALAASLAVLYGAYNYRPAGYNVKDGFDSLKNDINAKAKNDPPTTPMV